MTDLWFYETVSVTGRWSPNTSPAKPDTCRVGGHLREKRVGGIGPRIRNIIAVPTDMRDMPLGDLQAALIGTGEAVAVEVHHG